MKERIDKGDSKDKAFAATQKSSVATFNSRLSKCVDDIIADTQNLGFAVYIDKNVLPNQFPGLQKQLNEFKSRLESHHITIKVLGLIPHCLHPSPQEHPFSYNYLLQTYMRCHFRKDHPTIDSSTDHLNPISIS